MSWISNSELAFVLAMFHCLWCPAQHYAKMSPGESSKLQRSSKSDQTIYAVQLNSIRNIKPCATASGYRFDNGIIFLQTSHLIAQGLNLSSVAEEICATATIELPKVGVLVTYVGYLISAKYQVFEELATMIYDKAVRDAIQFYAEFVRFSLSSCNLNPKETNRHTKTIVHIFGCQDLDRDMCTLKFMLDNGNATYKQLVE